MNSLRIRTASVLAGILLVALTGCESTRHDLVVGVTEKFSGPIYTRRVVTADSVATFAAAKTALTQQGFRITRAGLNQGVIEGLSGLTSDTQLRGARQLTAKVRLTALVDGGTEVAVRFTEVVEDDFNKGAGQGAETTLRDDSIYDIFFGHLDQALAR